jgi:hypothetical protein
MPDRGGMFKRLFRNRKRRPVTVNAPVASRDTTPGAHVEEVSITERRIAEVTLSAAAILG